jgi:hypothetical protein
LPAAAAAIAPYASHPILAPTVLGFFRDAPELAPKAQGDAKIAAGLERVLAKKEAAKASAASRVAVAKASDVPALLRDRTWRTKSGEKAVVMKRPPIVCAQREKVELSSPQRDFESTERDVTFRDMTKAELAKWRKEAKKDDYFHVDYESARRSSGAYEYHRVPLKEGLAEWNQGKGYTHQSPLRWLARHGLVTVPGFMSARWIPWLAYDEEYRDTLSAVVCIASPRVAPVLAKASRYKRARRKALAWFAEHAEIGAAGLVPDAVAEQGEARRDAEEMLLHLAKTGAGAAVRRAAKSYGKDIARAIEALLTRDPLALGVAPPKPPAFLRASELPIVKLRSGKSIGDDARDALVEMLQAVPIDAPYAGYDVVRKACDEASLAALALELTEQWILGDAPGRHEWMLFATVRLASDAGTRRVAAFAREQARKNQAKAKRACAALAAIGTDVALLHLAHVAETTRYDALRKEASTLLGDAASARELTIDELGDRTVPDAGIDDGGTLTLSYGARAFVVSLDETLAPIVHEKGAKKSAPMKTLPRPAREDDAAAAKASRERFDVLKKELAQIASRQLRRLERAMVDARAWSFADFTRLIAKHPLLVHLARRLVWEASVGKGAPKTFRVAEDGTLGDERDRVLRLPASARIRLAHPARTPDLTKKWSALLFDYEIVQPFEQVARAVTALDRAEQKARALERTAGAKAAGKKVLGVLESRGWRRDSAGHVHAYLRDVRTASGAPAVARLPIAPGIAIESIRDCPDQETSAVTFEDEASKKPLAAGAIDAMCVSEILRDVGALTLRS